MVFSLSRIAAAAQNCTCCLTLEDVTPSTPNPSECPLFNPACFWSLYKWQVKVASSPNCWTGRHIFSFLSLPYPQKTSVRDLKMCGTLMLVFQHLKLPGMWKVLANCRGQQVSTTARMRMGQWKEKQAMTECVWDLRSNYCRWHYWQMPALCWWAGDLRKTEKILHLISQEKWCIFHLFVWKC